MINIIINKGGILSQLAAARSNIKMEIRKATQQVGKHLKGKVQEAFDAGGPGWAPLASSTVATKGHATILIDTSKLRGTMKVNIFSFAHGRLTPGSGGYSRGRSVTRVAIWHEGGTVNMPARPIFQPVAEREGQNVATIYRNALMRALGGM